MRQTGGGQEAQALQALLVAEWQARLVRLLATRPDAADELRALFGAEPRDAAAPEQRITGSMTLEAHVSGGDAFLAGRDMTITRGDQA